MVKLALLANRNRVFRKEFGRISGRRRELRENVSGGSLFIDGACRNRLVVTARGHMKFVMKRGVRCYDVVIR